MDAAALQDHGSNGAGPSAAATVLRKIPRPPNAFILYRSNKMHELKNQNSDSSLSETGLDKLDYQRRLSKVIGQLWRNESEQVKATFYEKAKQAAKEHQERYPEYRFKPTVKKAVSREPDTPVAAAVVDRTPERRGDTDFSPGDLSGPLSGSGSGSGRKRASLEGARSKASPYSTNRHRRTSSIGPSSPTARRPNINTSHPHAPVLLYAADDPAGHAGAGVPLTRSVSFGASSSSRSSSQRRIAKPSARRSLDGQVSHAATASNSFSTLVPQHLRDTRVFLAPHPPPPLPIGQAITTDEPGTLFEAQDLQQRVRKPKCSLFDAVKSALPPERRAFLQASLAMKGLLYSGDANAPVGAATSSTANLSTAPTAQSNSWSRMNSGASAQAWQSQETASNPSSRSSYTTTAQSELSPNLDPANQACLGMASYVASSVNIHTDASFGADYVGLSDWSQPDPCWLDYCRSFSGAAPFPSASEDYDGQVASGGQSQQPTSAQGDPQPYDAQPLTSFGSIDFSQYVPEEHQINHANSAFVALSEPDSTGLVQGHFYGLDGQLVGQGAVAGTQLVPHADHQHLDQEARQRRVVDQLLIQMMASSETSNSVMDCPLHPELIDAGASHVQGGSQDPASSAYDQAQLQNWSQTASLKLEGGGEQGGSHTPMVDAGPQFGSRACGNVHDGFQSNAFESLSPSEVPVPTSQEWMEASTQNHEHIQLASPRTSRNFSRPIFYEVSPQDRLPQSSSGITSNSSPSDEAGQARHEPAQFQPDTVDPAQLARSSEQQPNDSQQLPAEESHQQSVQQSLRNWKASRLSSFKDKLARVRHKATPSTSSLSVDRAKDNA
ncbi:probable HMG-box protein Hmg3 [Sporisorium scitamineum]|uniref:Probable HMG-box protein Hmg3 n=1 Tax=Sporisorium scitamineum TaxID=49012 RepID=A0A0F7S327_9BASI|nr:probable HMG-box protein Hmg3 [Sporisorium scitamineum]CDS01362.1 hypothetical protein [Sporisorium scitamineum]